MYVATVPNIQVVRDIGLSTLIDLSFHPHCRPGNHSLPNVISRDQSNSKLISGNYSVPIMTGVSPLGLQFIPH
jgi:hypothetical protein